MQKHFLPRLFGALLAAAVLTACSPTFDWRDFRSADAPYAVLFPGKPATHTRDVQLDGAPVSMTMAAAEAAGTTFAVGSAALPDAARAQAAIVAMKTAMASNIGAVITSEKTATASAGGKLHTSIAIEAKGVRNGEATLLVGRFIAVDRRVYQLIVIGKEKKWNQDAVDTFMTSFKLN